MRSKLKWLILAAAIVLIAVAVTAIFGKSSAPKMQEGNLLTNGDFSQAGDDGLPSGWYTDAYIHTVGYTDYSMENGVVTIVNHALNDARFAQKVTVQPDSLYCLTGYIRAQASGGLGANLSVSDVYAFSQSVYDSDEWQKVTLYGRTGKDQRSVTVFVRLGGYSGEATGTASFKDISLTQVQSVPAEFVAQQWYKNSTAKTSTSTKTSSSSAWPWLTAIAVIYALACWFLSRSVLGGESLTEDKHNWLPLVGIIAVAVAARCAIAFMIPGYGVDIGCFTAWANQMANNGAAEFYSSGTFCDYPPGYILVLGLLGSIGKAFGTGTTEFLVKLPSIMCDAAAAALLFVYSKKYISGKAAFTISALYAFNPLTFAAGAAWGQADSVMALCILLVVILAIENKWYAALPVYMLAVLMKPQALMFGPLGLVALVGMIIREKNKKILIHTAIGLAAAAVVAVLVILPFSKNMDNSEGWWVIRLYQSTMGYYANATVNACNLYFLFGKNWASVVTDAPLVIRACAAVILLGGTIAGAVRWQWYKRGKVRLVILAVLILLIIAAAAVPMSYQTLGRLVIVISVLLCVGMYLKENSIRHLPLLGAVQLLLLCCTGTMMHERYLFPAIVLLALACVIERDWRVYILFILATVCTFLNVGAVLDRGVRIGGVDGHLDAPLFRIVSDSAALEYAISALLCIITAFSGYLAFGICMEGESVSFRASEEEAPAQIQYSTYSPFARELDNPEKLRRMRWQDWVIIAVVTVIYSVVALTNLGSTTSPQTWWRSETSSDSVMLDLGQKREFKMLYLGGIHNRDMEFTVRTSDDGINWSEPYWAQITEGQCFQWQYVRQVNTYDGTRNYSSVAVRLSGRFVKIEAKSIALTLYEVILRDPDTQEVFPVKVREGAGENLIDEQDTFTGEPGWYNSTYFDEIYHARTGYEHYLAMNGDYTYRPYETSHPPLGKVLMAFSISIFGMTPFGWRFAGALAGILMLPGLYLLGKLLTKRRLMAAAAMLLMALDCMHFTQTRIATIDSFVVLFIIWSMVFMVYYVRMDYWNKPFWKTLVPLFLSGVFMGLAVASKWTGCYAGVGLALLFFWSVYRRLRQSMYARDAIEVDPALAELPRYKAASEGLWKRPAYTMLSCLVFFVAIPAAIYYCSYIPYFLPYSPSGVTLQRVIEAAEGMFNYHSIPGLGMDHPFYSPWYEWPVIGKPMWYYSATYRPEGGTQTIVAMGNPAVWWGGLLALAAVLVIWILRHFRRGGISLHTKQNDMRPAILLIAFAAQFAPWMLVPRGTYIYHYFTSVPFIILCTVLCFDLLQDMTDSRFALKADSDGSRNAKQKVLHYLPSGILVLFLLAAAALFIAFFPYASGQTASYGWLEAMKWFDRWIYY